MPTLAGRKLIVRNRVVRQEAAEVSRWVGSGSGESLFQRKLQVPEASLVCTDAICSFHISLNCDQSCGQRSTCGQQIEPSMCRSLYGSESCHQRNLGIPLSTKMDQSEVSIRMYSLCIVYRKLIPMPNCNPFRPSSPFLSTSGNEKFSSNLAAG